MNFSLSFVLKCACAVSIVVVVGCGPNDGKKEFERGRDAYEVHDLTKAGKLFEESLLRAPKDVDRLLYLARVKMDLGEIAAAKELVSRAALNSDGDVDVSLLLAQIAWHEKDYKKATAIYASLAVDKNLSEAIRAQAWAELGVVEMTCNSLHFARIAFLRAIRIDRRNAAARYHLGLLYRDGFAYLEAAIEQFEVFVRLEATASPRVQKVQRKIIPELKESILRRAAERPGVSRRNSSACSTALAKAESEWKRGSYKNARQSYQVALSADPLSYRAALGLAKAWEGTDSTKVGLTKAFENYRLACTLSPSAVSTFLKAGSLASRLDYNAQAVEIYSRAVAASPTSYDALDGLIRALRKVGNKTSKASAQAYQSYRDSLAAKKR